MAGSLFEGNVGFLFGESPLLSYGDFSRFSVFMKVKGALSLIYTAAGFALACSCLILLGLHRGGIRPSAKQCGNLACHIL